MKTERKMTIFNDHERRQMCARFPHIQSAVCYCVLMHMEGGIYSAAGRMVAFYSKHTGLHLAAGITLADVRRPL